MIFACGSRPCGHVYPQCELRPGASSGCPPVWTGRLPADRTDPSRLRVRLAHEPPILRRAAPPPGPGGHVPDAAGPAPLPERLGADGRRSGILVSRHDANADPTRAGKALGARVGSRRQLGDRADAPPGGAQWRQPGVVAELRAPSLETWGRALARLT